MRLLAEGIRVQIEHTGLFRVAGPRLSDKDYYFDQWVVFCMYGETFVSKTGLKIVSMVLTI